MALMRSIVAALAAGALALAPAAAADPSSGAAPAPSVGGRLLVAAPGMPDPRFAEAVIYMVRHDARGAFGLIINRPLGAGPLGKLLKGFGLPSDGAGGDVTLHFGGPVEPDSLYVLHSSEWRGQTTFGVEGRLAVTATPEVFRAIAGGSGPKRWLLVIGYAGWGPGQLESEMARDDWLSAPADADLVFDRDAETKWNRVSAVAGITL